jgi:hypothetical protein
MHSTLKFAGLIAIWCSLFAPAAADSFLDEMVPQSQPSVEPDVAPGYDDSTPDYGGSESCCCFDCCCDGLSGPRVLGFLPSDHCFDDFISPISNPFFFEDPRALTEVRGIFIDNSVPSGIGGGDAQVYAGQLRGRVSENFSVIAPRLADLQVNQAGGGNPSGFLAAPVGMKVTLIRNVEEQFLVSAGLTYFINGSARAASNFGNGDFHFFLTGGKRIFDFGHWLSGAGFRIPSDSNLGTQLFYWSNQWDYQLPNNIYPLVGVNWFHWMRSASSGFPNPVTGLDLINLPVSNIAGANVVTGVVGAKWKPTGHFELGSGFEFPLTNRTDILHNRLYVDVIFRY